MRTPLAKSAKSNQTDFEILSLFLPTQYLRTNVNVLVKFKPYSWTNYNTYSWTNYNTYSWTNYNTYVKNDKFFNHFEIYMFKFWT